MPRWTIVQGESVETLEVYLVLANGCSNGQLGDGDYACGGRGDAGTGRYAEVPIISVNHVSAPDNFGLRIGRGGKLQSGAREYHFPLRRDLRTKGSKLHAHVHASTRSSPGAAD